MFTGDCGIIRRILGIPSGWNYVRELNGTPKEPRTWTPSTRIPARDWTQAGLENIALVLCCFGFFFKSCNFVSFRVCRQFKRELWYTLVGLTHLNGEFNCRPRNRWLLQLRMRFIEKKEEKKKDAGREYNKWQMIHSEAVIGYMKFLIDHSAAEEGRLSSWFSCILTDCFAHSTVTEFKARQR